MTSKFIPLIGFGTKLVESPSMPKFNVENTKKHNRLCVRKALVHKSRLKLKKWQKFGFLDAWGIGDAWISTLPMQKGRWVMGWRRKGGWLTVGGSSLAARD